MNCWVKPGIICGSKLFKLYSCSQIFQQTRHDNSHYQQVVLKQKGIHNL